MVDALEECYKLIDKNQSNQIFRRRMRELINLSKYGLICAKEGCKKGPQSLEKKFCHVHQEGASQKEATRRHQEWRKEQKQKASTGAS
jgi:hypothetical protein